MTTTTTTSSEQDYAAAADWAEHDMTLSVASTSSLRGADAAAYGRDLLDRASGGRPSIDPDAKPGQHSPRRQVRLPVQVSAALDELAEIQHRKASALIRDAVNDYLAAHHAG